MQGDIKEEDWQAVEAFFEKRFGKKPDLQAMLYLIGINEFGQLPKRKKFTKEQKQDLIHVATCHLLIPFDYYMFEGRDADGWPHYLPVRKVEEKNLESQEELLKKAIILYIKNIENEKI